MFYAFKRLACQGQWSFILTAFFMSLQAIYILLLLGWVFVPVYISSGVSK